MSWSGLGVGFEVDECGGFPFLSIYEHVDVNSDLLYQLSLQSMALLIPTDEMPIIYLLN